MEKQDILDMLTEQIIKHEKEMDKSQYSRGFIDGLKCLWVDINYELIKLNTKKD